MKTQKYSTLIEALREAPPNKPFVTLWHDDNDIETVTFGDFIRLAEAKALQLIRLGIGKGDIVILIHPQDINVMAAFAGTMMIGAIPSILAYPNFKVEPSKYKRGLMGVCSNLGARLILVDDKFPSDLIDLIEKSQETRVRIIRDSTGSVEKPERLSLQDIDSEKIAFIQHSAGTTGLQKGVSLSHSAVLRQIEHLVDVLTINERDKLYNWLPLYHDMGLIACFMLPMAVHLSVIMQPPVEWVMRPSTMMRLISVFECTMAWVPNFALQFIARRTPDEEKNDLNLSSLRALINCSEPVRAKSLDEFYSVFKNRGLHKNSLKTSYAMAENVFAVTQSESSSEPSRLWANETVYRDEHRVVPVSSDGDRSVCFVSSGSCLPENEVRILDKNGTDLTDGYIGEIAIASDSLFTGYFKRPDLTNEVLSKGWYLPGDLGLKMDGELYVTGRKKDLPSNTPLCSRLHW